MELESWSVRQVGWGGTWGLGGLAEQSLIEGRAVNPLSCHPVQPNLTLKWDPRAIIVAMFFLHKVPTRI